MGEMQSDFTSIQARDLASAIAAVRAEGVAADLQEMLRGWDGRLSGESAEALVLHFVCEALAARTVRKLLGQAPTAPDMQLSEERRVLHEQLMARSTLMLDGETWEAAIEAALDEATGVLEARFGPDRAAWRWDAMHRIQWRHNLGREAPLAEVLNPPPVPIGGDATSPFNAVSDANGNVPLSVSYRQIFDLADLNAAQIVIPPGNSGQPGSAHYADNIEPWRTVTYHPLFVNWDDIESNAEAHLALTP